MQAGEQGPGVEKMDVPTVAPCMSVFLPNCSVLFHMNRILKEKRVDCQDKYTGGCPDLGYFGVADKFVRHFFTRAKILRSYVVL